MIFGKLVDLNPKQVNKLEIVTANNFELFAARNYSNINCIDKEEFDDDVKRFKYIGRLVSRYRDKNDLQVNLLLNHIVILYNVFEVQACTKMLCFKFRNDLRIIKPFLVYLGYWPEEISGIGDENETIIGSDIPIDTRIVAELRGITND